MQILFDPEAQHAALAVWPWMPAHLIRDVPPGVPETGAVVPIRRGDVDDAVCETLIWNRFDWRRELEIRSHPA